MDSDQSTLTRLSWQTTLFCQEPKRFDLAKLVPDWPLRPITLRVHRNHAFEHVATVMQKWMNWYSTMPELSLSDYDDSLSFNSVVDASFDIDLVWIDLSRYSDELEHTWLVGRLNALRARSTRPILLATIGGNNAFKASLNEDLRGVGAVYYHDLEEALDKLGVEKYSPRTAQLTGTRLSEKSMMMIAREIACRIIPDCLGRRKKAIVLDLDGTLYSGVLGEQGPRGVTLTESHRELHNALLGLKKQGYFLAMASRNEEEDVRELFRVRNDFPLRWNDFSAHEISWQKKSSSLRAIADKLRVGVDSFVFVDDNPGELVEIASEFPTVGLIHAHEDASITTRTVEYYPGLWKTSISREDAVRASDLEANQQREEIRLQASDPKSYLSSLGVHLDFHLDDPGHLARMVELSSKTNQFNLALNRYTELDFQAMLSSDRIRIVSVGLADKLSDSGLIALCVCDRKDNELVVRELAISCRALGRGLEDIIVGKSIEIASKGSLKDVHLTFHYKTGPRNKPGLDWLAKRANSELLNCGSQTVPFWTSEITEICSAIHMEYHGI